MLFTINLRYQIRQDLVINLINSAFSILSTVFFSNLTECYQTPHLRGLSYTVMMFHRVDLLCDVVALVHDNVYLVLQRNM